MSYGEEVAGTNSGSKTGNEFLISTNRAPSHGLGVHLTTISNSHHKVQSLSQEYPSLGSRTAWTPSQPTEPVAMRVCSESRTEALKKYTLNLDTKLKIGYSRIDPKK